MKGTEGGGGGGVCGRGVARGGHPRADIHSQQDGSVRRWWTSGEGGVTEGLAAGV